MSRPSATEAATASAGILPFFGRRTTFFRQTSQEEHDDELPLGPLATQASAHAQRLATVCAKRASRWVEAARNGVDKDDGRTTSGPQVPGNGMFADADNLRSQIRQGLNKKEYDIADYYHKTGFAQMVARNQRWQSVTLVVIAINSLWIGLEIELNDEANLNDAPWYFQVGEYFFCAFFMFEWFDRFFALDGKYNGLRDKWFVFDACLVFMMVAETLVLPHALPSSDEEAIDEEGSGGSEVGQFGMLRMLRLLRLTRMVRFMRSVPELVTLLKSMGLAGKPLLSTLLLQMCLLYIFGIIFKSQLQADPGTRLHEKFGRVTSAMATLLLQGTLLDSISKTANPLLDESPVLAGLFLVFMLLSSFTVLNLLIGMVCEVVNVVALTEKEKAMVSYVKGKLMHVLEELDEDGNGTISKSEFDRLMEIPAAIQALQELGIDLPNLVSLSDHLFEGEDFQDHEKKVDAEEDWYEIKELSRGIESDKAGRNEGLEEEREKLLNDEDPQRLEASISHSSSEDSEGKCLTFGEFIEMVIRLRPDSHPSVVDCVDLRKLYLKGQKQINQTLENLEEMNAKLVTDIQRNICHHPLFIVICNHPEMQRRRRLSVRQRSTSVTGSACCQGQPASRREDDRRKLATCDEAPGLSSRELQQQLARPLDKGRASSSSSAAWHSVAPHAGRATQAEDDRSVSSRDAEIPEELRDHRDTMSERLRTRTSNGHVGRHRKGQLVAGGSSSSSGWCCPNAGRRPSEGKLARILAATSSSSSGDFSTSVSGVSSRVLGKAQAGDFSKDNKAWQLDEDVLRRVLSAANLYDEDDDWAIGSDKAMFRSGREQTNTTGTGSATTGSPSAELEAESFDSRSQGVSVADETLDYAGGSPMVQTPRTIQSIFARHKANRGSEADDSPSLTRLEAFLSNLGHFRLVGSGAPTESPCSVCSSSTAAPVTNRAQAVPHSDNMRAESCYASEDCSVRLELGDMVDSVDLRPIPVPSEAVASIDELMVLNPLPVPVTHASGVTMPIDDVVMDEGSQIVGVPFSCTQSSLCCGQNDVSSTPVRRISTV